MPGQAFLGSLPTELSCTEAGGVVLRAGLKRYFFDTFQNPNGSFFRITEVWSCLCAHKVFGMIAARIYKLSCFPQHLCCQPTEVRHATYHIMCKEGQRCA